MKKTLLKSVLDTLGVSMRALARACRISPPAARRLVMSGQWPCLADRAMLEQRLCAFLLQHGLKHGQLLALREAHVLAIDPGVLGSLFAAAADCDSGTAEELCEAVLADATPAERSPRKKAPAGMQPAGALLCPANPRDDQPLEDTMLLECTPLTEQARKAWGLARSPFADDVSSREDVFATPATRYVRAALLDCAMHHGFIAIVGESGSGKTTLREDLEQRILDEQRPVIVIKPYTLAMEPNDVKGKQMKSGEIAESIAHALAPSVQLKSSPQARFRQVHELLRDSARAGRRHLLVIEEAHRMPLATLKHLKGWMELKDGLRRLLGVCLIGQPELDTRLSETQPEIREIVQRCEKVWVDPLDEHLQPYLAHKFARVGADAGAVLAADAYDALRARLVQIPRGGTVADAYSICYPLVVNNLVARAMNAAARNGWPRVDAQVVAGS